MIKQYSYSFSDLAINPLDLAVLLGYLDGKLPEPFSGYVADALRKAETLCNIRGAVFLSDHVQFSEKEDRMIVGGLEFNIGKTIGKELRNSETIVLFIGTAGEKISEISRNLLAGDDPVLGYVYDVLGSLTVEAAIDQIFQEIRKMAESSGQLATNRYSPGYCHWSVADQPRLFSFFPENCCGISLTDSALMYPIKSVSGSVGIGKDVKFREYTCDLCNLTDCFYRNRHKPQKIVFG